MAKSLKHTAIDPNGVKHTRTSQSRVYAYTVVARSNYARDVAMAGKLFEQDRRNFDFYTKMVAWGGANEGVIKMLQEIGDLGQVDAYVEECLKQKRKIMGIGHRVYKVLDPRAPHLKRMAQVLSAKLGELARNEDLSRYIL